MRVKNHGNAGGWDRPRPQQAGRILDRLRDDARQVELAEVAAVGEGEPGLHFRVLFGDGVEHAIGDRSRIPGAQPIAVERLADATHARIQCGRPALHFEGEIDLALGVGRRMGGRREPVERVDRFRLGQHVRVFGGVVATVFQRLIDQPVERRRLQFGGVREADPVFAEGAQADAAAFG